MLRGHVQFISLKVLGTIIIFRLLCLKAKVVHATFVTEKYNDLLKREIDQNKGLKRDVPHILLT